MTTNSAPAASATSGPKSLDDLTAQLAAEIAVTTFRIAITRWLNQQGNPDLATTIDQTLAAMGQLTNTPSIQCGKAAVVNQGPSHGTA